MNERENLTKSRNKFCELKFQLPLFCHSFSVSFFLSLPLLGFIYCLFETFCRLQSCVYILWFALCGAYSFWKLRRWKTKRAVNAADNNISELAVHLDIRSDTMDTRVEKRSKARAAGGQEVEKSARKTKIADRNCHVTETICASHTLSLWKRSFSDSVRFCLCPSSFCSHSQFRLQTKHITALAHTHPHSSARRILVRLPARPVTACRTEEFASILRKRRNVNSSRIRRAEWTNGS